MEAKDLMIGNYVECQNLRPVIVTDITYSFLYYDFVDKSDRATWNFVKPIPLTEQWLIDFGFDKRLINNLIPEYYKRCTPPNYKKDYHLCFRFGERRDETFTFYWYPMRHSGEMHTFPCKYVHQLQNLYKSLTGKQLTK